MNQCLKCGKETRSKFCSRSCAASYNNQGVQRHGREPIACAKCGKQTRNAKYCSHECRAATQREKCHERIRNGQYDLTWSGNQTLRKFLIEDRGYRCECCGLSEWMGEPIPLSVHHKDGDASNNAPINLSLICLNCHGVTPNFGRKNKQGSRKYRYCLRSSDGQSANLVSLRS